MGINTVKKKLENEDKGCDQISASVEADLM